MKQFKCIKCETTEIKHRANGLCKNCYYKEYSKTPKRKAYMRKYNKEYYEIPEHKEQKKEYNKTPERREYKKEYQKKRLKADPKYRLDKNMGRLMSISLKSEKAGRSWKNLIGYSIEKLIKHLEKQFDDKMSWDNYGSYWHVHHKKARSLFAYIHSTDPEFKKCWALNNLQPLEGILNLQKGNRY